MLSLGGLVMVLLLLGACFQLYPLFKKIQFKNKHVHPYQPKKGRRIIDPITSEPLETGEMVVTKCQQTVALATWEMDGHCPFYPDCMGEKYLGCNGAGAPEKGASLFSMNGVYRYLNWLWFWSLGWLLLAGCFML